jgi:hypothetical protein
MKEFIVTLMERKPKIFYYNGENYQLLLVSFILLFFFFSIAYISNGKVMGWGNKAIEIRNVDSGTLDGVFMHKRSQKLK